MAVFVSQHSWFAHSRQIPLYSRMPCLPLPLPLPLPLLLLPLLHINRMPAPPLPPRSVYNTSLRSFNEEFDFVPNRHDG